MVHIHPAGRPAGGPAGSASSASTPVSTVPVTSTSHRQVATYRGKSIWSRSKKRRPIAASVLSPTSGAASPTAATYMAVIPTSSGDRYRVSTGMRRKGTARFSRLLPAYAAEVRRSVERSSVPILPAPVASRAPSGSGASRAAACASSTPGGPFSGGGVTAAPVPRPPPPPGAPAGHPAPGRDARSNSPSHAKAAPHARARPMRRAGTPSTGAKSGTSFVTTAPAAMNAQAPAAAPQTVVALAPTPAPWRMRVVA